MITSINDILPLVIPELPNCPDGYILQQIKKTWADFCYRTECWKKKIDPFDIVAGESIYDLPLGLATSDSSPDPFIKRIDKVEYNDTMLEVAEYDLQRVQDDAFQQQLKLNFTPDKDIAAGLIVTVRLVPDKDFLPLDLINRYQDAITNGTLANLQINQQAKWYNPNLAQKHQSDYDKYVAVALRENVIGHKNATAVMTGRSFL